MGRLLLLDCLLLGSFLIGESIKLYTELEFIKGFEAPNNSVFLPPYPNDLVHVDSQRFESIRRVHGTKLSSRRTVYKAIVSFPKLSKCKPPSDINSAKDTTQEDIVYNPNAVLTPPSWLNQAKMLNFFNTSVALRSCKDPFHDISQFMGLTGTEELAELPPCLAPSYSIVKMEGNSYGTRYSFDCSGEDSAVSPISSNGHFKQGNDFKTTETCKRNFVWRNGQAQKEEKICATLSAGGDETVEYFVSFECSKYYKRNSFKPQFELEEIGRFAFSFYKTDQEVAKTGGNPYSKAFGRGTVGNMNRKNCMSTFPTPTIANPNIHIAKTNTNPIPSDYNPNPSVYNPNPSVYNSNPSVYNPNPSGYYPNPSGYYPNPSGYYPNPSGYYPTDVWNSTSSTKHLITFWGMIIMVTAAAYVYIVV